MSSWPETSLPSLYVFLESISSHLCVFEILFQFWCLSEWFSKCHQYPQTLYSPHAKLSVCALVYGGLAMDGMYSLELVQWWFLWVLCYSLCSKCWENCIHNCKTLIVTDMMHTFTITGINVRICWGTVFWGILFGVHEGFHMHTMSIWLEGCRVWDSRQKTLDENEMKTWRTHCEQTERIWDRVIFEKSQRWENEMEVRF